MKRQNGSNEHKMNTTVSTKKKGEKRQKKEFYNIPQGYECYAVCFI